MVSLLIRPEISQCIRQGWAYDPSLPHPCTTMLPLKLWGSEHANASRAKYVSPSGTLKWRNPTRHGEANGGIGTRRLWYSAHDPGCSRSSGTAFLKLYGRMLGTALRNVRTSRVAVSCEQSNALIYPSLDHDDHFKTRSSATSRSGGICTRYVRQLLDGSRTVPRQAKPFLRFIKRLVLACAANIDAQSP